MREPSGEIIVQGTPSNEARNAMLKLATQLGVTPSKEGQIRKAEDVAEDLEVRMSMQ